MGAGPGDPDLITVAGLERIRRANVIVYDRLIHPHLLSHAPRTAERVFAGKTPGLDCSDQRDIERLLVERASHGKRVVRLKGGDPFVFGRGAEEIVALEAAGVPWEVIPGVAAAVAAPAAANIPLTHRELASSVTIVTGHEDPGKPESGVDWEWVAAGSGTIVIMMGLERLEDLCLRLIEGGRDLGLVSHLNN